jgi:tetratricopeptide (TPR) repeat protein
MRLSLFALSLYGALAAAPAWAGVTVLGTGNGRECYEETLLDPTPMRNLDALAICARAIEDSNVDSYNRAAAYVNRGDILLRMQRFAEAVADSDKAIAIDHAMGAAHINRGAAMIGLQRYDEALASLNRAIEIGAGKLQLAYFDRGMAKENLGDVKGAYLDYRKAAELDPSFQLAADQLARFTVKTR